MRERSDFIEKLEGTERFTMRERSDFIEKPDYKEGF